MNQRGIALISAILMGLVLLLVGMGISGYIISGGNIFTQITQKDEVLNIADAGLEWAIANFDPDNLGGVAGTATFGNGAYEIVAPTMIAPNQRYLFKIMAYLPSKEHPKYQRAVQAIIEAQPDPIFDYALATGGDLNLTGGSLTINSSPDPNQGNIHSNGDISANGHPNIEGHATAGGTNAVDGGTANAAKVQIPALTAARINSLYLEALTHGTTVFSDFNGTLNGYYAPYAAWTPKTVSGETFSFSGNNTIPTNGVVFIDGDLVLSGGSSLSGSGTIYVNGTVKVTGNVSISGSLSIVSLSSDTEAISIGGNVSAGTPEDKGNDKKASNPRFWAYGGTQVSTTPYHQFLVWLDDVFGINPAFAKPKDTETPEPTPTPSPDPTTTPSPSPTADATANPDETPTATPETEPPNNLETSAIFFAPIGGIRVHGNPTIVGSIVAGGLGNINGSVIITRITTRTEGLHGFSRWKVTNWREITL